MVEHSWRLRKNKGFKRRDYVINKETRSLRWEIRDIKIRGDDCYGWQEQSTGRNDEIFIVGWYEKDGVREEKTIGRCIT